MVARQRVMKHMKYISEFQVGNTWQLTNDPTRVFIEFHNQHTRVFAIVFITGNKIEEFHLYSNLVGSKSAITCNKQYIMFFQMFLFLLSFFFLINGLPCKAKDRTAYLRPNGIAIFQHELFSEVLLF